MHDVLALLQAAIVSITPDNVFSFILKALELVIGGLIAWVAKDIRSMKTSVNNMNQTMVEWRVHFFGVNNNGGLTDRVDKMEKRAYGWDKQLGDHENRIISLEKCEDENPHIHRRRDD